MDTTSLACLFAIFLGLIPAIIAKNKGHNFLIWWIFGAALFIAALPLAILLKPNTKEMEQLQLQNGEMKKCPYCAELIKAEATICRYCGKDISDVLPEDIECPMCGDELELDNKERIEKKFICALCGEFVDMTQEN